MKFIQLLVAVFSVLIVYTSAQTAPCSATIVPTPRLNSAWTTYPNIPNQLFDLVITNVGSCPILSLVAVFTLFANETITQSWNWVPASGMLSGFDGAINVGEVYSAAGFVLSGGLAISLNSYTPTCASSCAGVGATSALASSTGSGSSTGSLPSSSTSGSSSTTGAPPVNNTCTVAISISARAGAAFVYNGQLSQIYDLTFTNIGQAMISNLQIRIAPVSGTAVNESNKWNLVLSSTVANVYTVMTFGALTVGAQYAGAGFVLAGTNATTATPQVTVYSISC